MKPVQKERLARKDLLEDQESPDHRAHLASKGKAVLRELLVILEIQEVLDQR